MRMSSWVQGRRRVLFWGCAFLLMGAQPELQKPLGDGWVIALGARPDGNAAKAAAEELAKKGVPSPQILWMGDYASFNKKDFWLIYYGPMPRADKAAVKAQLKVLKGFVPDAYALLMSKTEKRQVLK